MPSCVRTHWGGPSEKMSKILVSCGVLVSLQVDIVPSMNTNNATMDFVNIKCTSNC